jgi:hypothetical protein
VGSSYTQSSAENLSRHTVLPASSVTCISQTSPCKNVRSAAFSISPAVERLPVGRVSVRQLDAFGIRQVLAVMHIEKVAGHWPELSRRPRIRINKGHGKRGADKDHCRRQEGRRNPLHGLLRAPRLRPSGGAGLRSIEAAGFGDIRSHSPAAQFCLLEMRKPGREGDADFSASSRTARPC